MDIKELRLKLGLTQKEMAARLKIDAVTVSRWERGTQRPSNAVLKRLKRLEENKIKKESRIDGKEFSSN